jgi:hypothetical protein
MKIIPVAKGLCSYIPGAYGAFSAKRTGGAVSARYCYSAWLRHLTLAHEAGMAIPPEVVAELGPGDSIGMGLAALLSGSRRYFGLDVFSYATNRRNLQVFDELVDLFFARADIPDEKEFPSVHPRLTSYSFPSHILDDDLLDSALRPERVMRIRRAVANLGRDEDDIISYFAPYYESAVLRPESVDMIFSQAVMEHVDDLTGAYAALEKWLKPGGRMQHVIDFTAHWLDSDWNGHWSYPDWLWKLVRGKRPYLINREPHSTHLDLIAKSGFSVVRDTRIVGSSGLPRNSFALRFRNMSEEDEVTRGCVVQAEKPCHELLACGAGVR